MIASAGAHQSAREFARTRTQSPLSYAILRLREAKISRMSDNLWNVGDLLSSTPGVGNSRADGQEILPIIRGGDCFEKWNSVRRLPSIQDHRRRGPLATEQHRKG